jgi:hypothetical protein
MTFINKQNIATLDGLKRSKNYQYDSTNKKVNVNDVDFKEIVSIYNITVNKMLYLVGDESRSGAINGNIITYNNNVSGVSDVDDLYILYKPKEIEKNDFFDESLKELQIISKYLKKIYNPE